LYPSGDLLPEQSVGGRHRSLCGAQRLDLLLTARSESLMR
jgi:hypothetical protein